MDKLKNIVNPGHSEVDELLYDTGKKHQRNDSALEAGDKTATAENPTEAGLQPGAGQPISQKAEQESSVPATGAVADENEDPSKPKKENKLLDKVLHPLGRKDHSGYDEAASKTETEQTTSEHHDRGKHAAEGAAAGGTAAAVASHEKHKHDQKAVEPAPTSRGTEPSNPGAAVAEKHHTPAEQQQETTNTEKKPSIIQKILHPGSSKTEKDTTAGDPSSSPQEQHHYGRDAALGAGAAGAAGTAAHEHHKHEQKKTDPATAPTTMSEAGVPGDQKLNTTSTKKEHNILSQILNPRGDKADDIRYGTTATTGDPSAQHQAVPERSSSLAGGGVPADQKAHEGHGARDAALGAGAAGAAYAGHKHHEKDHKAAEPQTTHADKKTHEGHGTRDAALGAGATGAAYAEHKHHEKKHKDAEPAAEKKAVEDDETPDRKPSLLQKILHPRSSKTESTADEHPEAAKEHHHHGAEAAGAGAAASAAYAAHHHHKDEHKNTPIHQESTAAPASTTTSATTSQAPSTQAPVTQPPASQYSAAPAVARGDPLIGSSPRGTGASGPAGIAGATQPSTAAQQPSSTATTSQHHYGRDAALGAGAAGAAYAAHEHQKDKQAPDAATSAAGAPATTGLADSHAYTRQEQPAAAQPTHGREAGSTAPPAVGSATHGSHGAGQDNQLSHHVHNSVTGSHGRDAHHHEHPHGAHTHAPGSQDQDRTHYGRDAALGGGAAAAAASAAYAAHQHHHDHGKDELSHHVHNGVSGTGSPTAARQAASAAYPAQGTQSAGSAAPPSGNAPAADIAGGQGVGNTAYTSGNTPATGASATAQPGSTVPHPSPEAQKQHHYGREAALGAGAAGAGGLAYHEHKKHHDDAAKSTQPAPVADDNKHHHHHQPKEEKHHHHHEKEKAAGGAGLAHHEHKKHEKHEKAAETTHPTAKEEEKKHHHGRDAALGAGAAGAAGAAAHEHKKHDEENVTGEKKESKISKIMDKILHPGKSKESKDEASPSHSKDSKTAESAAVPTAVAHDSHGSAVPASEHATQDRALPGQEGSVGRNILGGPADQKLHTDPNQKEHHTGRDAALGAGAVGAGVAAHEHHKHKDETPSGTAPTRSDTTTTTGSETGPASKTQGPHKSNILNVLDPRVKPDFQAQRERSATEKEATSDSNPSTEPGLATGAAAGTAGALGAGAAEKEGTSGTIAPHNTAASEHKNYPGVPEAKHPAAIGGSADNQSDNPYTAKPVDPRVHLPGSYPESSDKPNFAG